MIQSSENMYRRFCERLVLVCNQYSWYLLNLCQPNAWSQCDNVDVCPSGDVGSGHVLPSKIEQDETKGY